MYLYLLVPGLKDYDFLLLGDLFLLGGGLGAAFMHVCLRLAVSVFVLLFCVAGEDSIGDSALRGELRHGTNHTDSLAAFVQLAQIISEFMESVIESLGLQKRGLDTLDLHFKESLVGKLQPTILQDQHTHARGSDSSLSHATLNSLDCKEDNANVLEPDAENEKEEEEEEEEEKEEKTDEEEEGEEERERERERAFILMEAQNELGGEKKITIANFSYWWPCMDGYRALPSTAEFNCLVNDSFKRVSVLDYAKMSLHTRDQCTYASPNERAEACVCASSHLWVIPAGSYTRGSRCVPRRLLVSPRLESRHLCTDRAATALGLWNRTNCDYCLRVERNAVLDLEANISFRWLNNKEMRYHLPISGYIGNPDPHAQYVVLTDGTSGTYAELSLSEKLFFFALRPRKEKPNYLTVTMHHPLQLEGSFGEIIYPFSSPHRLESYHKHLPLNTTNLESFFGVNESYTTYRIQRDLSLVGDECISGSTVYMEVGFSGDGVLNWHRYARLWIRFTDLPERPDAFSYTKPINPALLVVVVLLVTIGIGFLVAVVWCCCKRNHKNDMNETLVSSLLMFREKEKKSQ